MTGRPASIIVDFKKEGVLKIAHQHWNGGNKLTRRVLKKFDDQYGEKF